MPPQRTQILDCDVICSTHPIIFQAFRGESTFEFVCHISRKSALAFSPGERFKMSTHTQTHRHTYSQIYTHTSGLVLIPLA